MIHGFFTKIYALSYPEVICAGSLFTLSILWLRQRYGRKLLALWCGMLLVWAAAVLYLTVWSRSGGGVYRAEWIPLHSYREVLAGGNPEILRSSFMNVILFFPAGLLLAILMPWGRPGWIRGTAIVLVLAAVSIGIERTQYVGALGNFEIDDILHNTLGAFLGCLSEAVGYILCRSRQAGNKTEIADAQSTI